MEEDNDEATFFSGDTLSYNLSREADGGGDLVADEMEVCDRVERLRGLIRGEGEEEVAT